MSHDPVEFADDWLDAMHPRRSGHRGRVPEFGEDPDDVLRAVIADGTADVDAILVNPQSDPELVSRAAGGELTPESAAVWWTLWTTVNEDEHVLLTDHLVRELGVVPAVAAVLDAAELVVRYGFVLAGDGNAGHALVTYDEPLRGHEAVARPDEPYWVFLGHRRLLEPLRRRLAAADETTWQAAVAAAEPYRSGSWRQRYAAGYLFPDRHEWVDADLADLPASSAFRAAVTVFSGYDVSQFGRTVACETEEIATVLDALGHAGTAVIVRSLRWYAQDVEARARLTDALCRLGTDAALRGLLDNVEIVGVAAAIERTAAADPTRALRLLRDRADDPAIVPLLTRHLARFPDPAAGDSQLPVASRESLPAVLVDPPWARSLPAVTAEVVVPDGPPTLHWADGEREVWSFDRWPVFEPDHYDAPEYRGWARFYLGGSEAAVRPLLATWRAEEFSFHLHDPRLLVGRWELDAYPPALRLARRKPVLGAGLLLPLRSTEVALTMARWLASSRQFRAVAQEWFARHGVDGAIPVLATALTRQDLTGRTATRAVLRMHPDTVTAAGDALGCRPAVDALLSRDPLEVLPGRVPAPPAWCDPALLPPVLTRTGEALADTEVTTLVRMLAISPLDDPYPGLAIARGACDACSLAEFAWHLDAAWRYAGRPSKDAWAMDALGHLGDDVVAARLAPEVRRWPSLGAAARAKRGVDVLAAMPGDTALSEVAAIARDARSTPLRTHASAALDGVAAVRGLLPEQLEDLVAPDLGLDAEPVSHRGVGYRVDLDDDLALVLHGPDGTVVDTLPKPVDADEKAAAGAWRKRRRAAAVTVRDQARRLEEAMVVQRRWTRREFATSVVAHPLLGRLARRLVWTLDGRPVGVDALGDLVDPGGGLAVDGEVVQLAHPARADLSPWRPALARVCTVQPFPQLDRDVHDGDPSQYWNSVVTASSLHALTRSRWHWGAAGRAATRDRIFRPVGTSGTVTLLLEPGLSAVQDPRGEPDQTIAAISFEALEHGELGVFTDLPRVTRSEILRELARLERRP